VSEYQEERLTQDGVRGYLEPPAPAHDGPEADFEGVCWCEVICVVKGISRQLSIYKRDGVTGLLDNSAGSDAPSA
jgi:hypothetical protein